MVTNVRRSVCGVTFGVSGAAPRRRRRASARATTGSRTLLLRLWRVRGSPNACLQAEVFPTRRHAEVVEVQA